jgi:tetratricopeptide (TPR) repeat protein
MRAIWSVIFLAAVPAVSWGEGLRWANFYCAAEQSLQIRDFVQADRWVGLARTEAGKFGPKDYRWPATDQLQARIFLAEKNWRLAVKLLDSALAGFRESSPRDAQIGICLADLADAFAGARDLARAEDAASQALDFAWQNDPDNAPNLAGMLCRRGIIRSLRKKDEAARADLLESLSIARRCWNGQTRFTEDALAALFLLEKRTGHPALAARYQKEAFEIHQIGQSVPGGKP